jgi:hypothetical protein
MSDALQLAIAEVEDYLRRYPSGRFSELAQLRLDQLLAQRGEKRVEVVSAAANPFSKGTVRADLSYRVGDRYEYGGIDLLTKIPGPRRVLKVTSVTDTQVVFNDGKLITDLLGNLIRRPDGATFGPNQFYATEYALGKKWNTRYSIVLANGTPDTVDLDLKVVARESITVPAGTFDTFRVEATGWRLGLGGVPPQSITNTYWVAPDKVARVVAIETWWRLRNRITRADRDELAAFAQKP